MWHKILNVENLGLVLIIPGVGNGSGEERIEACFPLCPILSSRKCHELSVAVQCRKWYDWFSVSSPEGKKSSCQSHKSILFLTNFCYCFEDWAGFGDMPLGSASIKIFWYFWISSKTSAGTEHQCYWTVKWETKGFSLQCHYEWGFLPEFQCYAPLLEDTDQNSYVFSHRLAIK